MSAYRQLAIVPAEPVEEPKAMLLRKKPPECTCQPPGWWARRFMPKLENDDFWFCQHKTAWQWRGYSTSPGGFWAEHCRAAAKEALTSEDYFEVTK